MRAKVKAQPGSAGARVGQRDPFGGKVIARLALGFFVVAIALALLDGAGLVFGSSPLLWLYARLPVDSVRVVLAYDYPLSPSAPALITFDHVVTEVPAVRALYKSVFESEPVPIFAQYNCGLGPQVNYALSFTFHGAPVLDAAIDLQGCDFIHLGALGTRWASYEFLASLAAIAPPSATGP